MNCKTLLCTVLALASLNLHAKPRQPMPPFPEASTFIARFDEPYAFFTAPLHAEGIELVDSWSGNALAIGPKGFIAWNTGDYAKSTVSPSEGSIRFWYAPTWNSGERSSKEAGTLLQTIAWTKSPFPLLAINVLPDGSGIAVSAGGKDPVLGTQIKWQAGQWHQIGLTYTGKETVLYIDGEAVARGAGIQLNMKSKATFGFCLGSDINAGTQAEGLYDEVYMFAYPLTPDDVGHNYRCYAPYAALGAISPEEELAQEEARARYQAMRSSQLAMQPMAFGASEAAAVDCTNGPLHLINMQFIATNEACVTIAGGQPNTLYDVFRTHALAGSLTNSWWVWVGRGQQCDTIVDTNAPADMAFYIAADTTDSDGDGLTDAYEALVVKTLPNQAPSITITSPTYSSSIEAPTDLVITVSATNFISSGYTVAKVDFYTNGFPAGTVSGITDITSFTIPNPAIGGYDLKAVLTDGVGAMATSAVSHVSITLPALASLKCWLKADALTLSQNAFVTNWPDSSGNTNKGTVSLSYAPKFLTNQVNGMPAVQFDATRTTFIGFPPFLETATQGEAFVVLKPRTGALWSFTANYDEQTQYTTNFIFESFGRSPAVAITNSALNSFHVFNTSNARNQGHLSTGLRSAHRIKFD